MIKTFEQYHELDPYGEEEWNEGGYKIKKYFSEYKHFQNGKRYYLMIENKMVINFETFEEDPHLPDSFLRKLEGLNQEDEEKLRSGEYFITNGFITSSDKFQKITYEELKKRIGVEFND